MAKRERGNPDWILRGWGEPTRAFKIPIRVGEKLQKFHEQGITPDEILERLSGDLNIKLLVNIWSDFIERGELSVPPVDRPAVERFLESLIEFYRE